MKSLKNIFSTVVLILITVLCFVFLLQNGDRVRVNLFEFSTPEKPLWMFVLGAFALGIVVTSLYTLLVVIKYKSAIRKQQKSLDVIQKELHQLRNQPMDDVPENEDVEVATLVSQDPS